MKLHTRSTFILATLLTTLGSCYYDNIEDLHPAPIVIPGVNAPGAGCDTAKAITYTTDIKPILANNCGANTGCHGGSSSNSGIDLSTYDGVKNSTALIGAITWDGTASNMPKGSTTKINDCSIAIIKKWVATGKAE